MFTIDKKTQRRLKPPFSYYGGKQKMVDIILPKIPEHNLYCEPFTGGAAIFFAKEPSKVEVLNDTNKELINFFRAMQTRFCELEKKVSVTLHSRSQYNDASVIYNHPHLHNEIDRAWAVWTLGAMGYSGILDGSWGYDRKSSKGTSATTVKRNRFNNEFAIRLQNVQIECADALYIIESRDLEDAFFYIDPPYYNSDMGHYDGYTIQDFEFLLRLLGKIKGRFLLSSYQSDVLKHYTKQNGWKQESKEYFISAGKNNGKRKRKVEVLTCNY